MQELINHINAFRFIKAAKYIEEHKSVIDPRAVDAQKNNLLHITITALKNYLASKNNNDEDEDVQEKISRFNKLINLLLEINVPSHTKNLNHKLPFNILMNIPGFWDLKKETLKKFDEKCNFLHSGRKYVSNLNLFKGSKLVNKVAIIPDEWSQLDDSNQLKTTLHQKLFLSKKYLLKRFEITGSTNTLLANIGFLVQDENNNISFYTIPIIDTEFGLVTEENYTLETEFENAVYPDILNSQNQIDGFKNAKTHSEWALIKYLHQDLKIDDIREALKVKFSPPQNYKIKAIILDINSHEEICETCENRLHKLQSTYHAKAFLKIIESKLSEIGYKLPNQNSDRINREYQPMNSKSVLANIKPRIQLILRVSASSPTNCGGKLDDNIPVPILCSQFTHNIKQHEQHVMLHSIPVNTRPINNISNDIKHSRFFSYDTLAEQSAVDIINSKKTINIPNPDSKFKVSIQTVFGSSGGNLHPINWENTGSLKDITEKDLNASNFPTTLSLASKI